MATMLCTLSVTAFAADGTGAGTEDDPYILNGIKYVFKETEPKTAAVFGHTADMSRDVVIPDKLTVDDTEYTVDELYSLAFGSLDVRVGEQDNTLETIQLPNTIKKLGGTLPPTITAQGFTMSREGS